jgi:hypothetical protein
MIVARNTKETQVGQWLCRGYISSTRNGCTMCASVETEAWYVFCNSRENELRSELAVHYQQQWCKRSCALSTQVKRGL